MNLANEMITVSTNQGMLTAVAAFLIVVFGSAALEALWFMVKWLFQMIVDIIRRDSNK